MKLRCALVPSTVLTPVRAAVETLRLAVNSGDMDGVDAATAELLALTAGAPAVDLSEQQWRAFLGGIRARQPDFESSYLLPGELCTAILPAASAGDLVLELPLDAENEEARDV